MADNFRQTQIQTSVLKTDLDIFVKFQKSLTSAKSDHMGSRYSCTTAKFELFLRNFECESEIRGLIISDRHRFRLPF